ncbi:MAG: hypothetical protein K2L54_03140, partial [Clostridiales bacterium]|nr:hypothetical protein [Clostridiales bacterium]
MTMLNNGELIKNLTEEQKIALVADIEATAGEAFASIGVPRLERTTVGELNRVYGGEAAYPDLSCLVNSWNTKLAENVVGDLVKRNGTDKYSLICTPSVAVKLNPYSAGLSEDPYLNSKFAGAFAAAIENSGGAACVVGLGLSDSDAQYIDRSPNPALLSNVVARPFAAVVKNRAPSAIGVSYSRVKGAYKDVNTALAERMLKSNALKAVIAENVYEEALRAGLSVPKLLFVGASTSAIRAAVKNYKRMKTDVERGAVTLGELEKAIAVGTAISDEILDIAVDKVIDFARAAVRPREQYGSDPSDGDNDTARSAPSAAEYGRQFALLTSQESTVLLKNDSGTLPIV